jgi:hypothetical protein
MSILFWGLGALHRLPTGRILLVDETRASLGSEKCLPGSKRALLAPLGEPSHHRLSARMTSHTTHPKTDLQKKKNLAHCPSTGRKGERHNAKR